MNVKSLYYLFKKLRCHGCFYLYFEFFKKNFSLQQSDFHVFSFPYYILKYYSSCQYKLYTNNWLPYGRVKKELNFHMSFPSSLLYHHLHCKFFNMREVIFIFNKKNYRSFLILIILCDKTCIYVENYYCNNVINKLQCNLFYFTPLYLPNTHLCHIFIQP